VLERDLLSQKNHQMETDDTNIDELSKKSFVYLSGLNAISENNNRLQKLCGFSPQANYNNRLSNKSNFLVK
jgi:hypothetical protein